MLLFTFYFLAAFSGSAIAQSSLPKATVTVVVPEVTVVSTLGQSTSASASTPIAVSSSASSLPASTVPVPNPMAQFAADLAQLPQCVQATAEQGIAASGCGTNLVCLCGSNNFLSELQGTIELACSPADQQKTLDFAKQLCASADPGINDSKAPEIVAVTVVIMVLATFAVIVRLVSRKISGAKFWWDDYLIVVALIITYGLDIVGFLSVHYGYGTHMITLSIPEITKFALTDFITQIVFALSISTTKISILLFYHRIFPSRRFTIIASALGILVMIWCLCLIFLAIFSCTPVNYFWDKSDPHGHCINENSLSYGITGANIVTDIFVLCLPFPWLWGLQMPMGKKMAIIGMFVLGGFVCIAGIVRIPLLERLKETDVSWTIVDAGIWIDVECNIGIVSACVPIMRPFFRAVFPAIFPASLRSRLSKSSHSNSSGDSDRKIFQRVSDVEAGSDGNASTRVGTFSSAEGGLFEKEPISKKAEKRQSRAWYTSTLASLTRGED